MFTVVVAGRPVFSCGDYGFAMIVFKEWYDRAKDAQSIAHRTIMWFFEGDTLLEEIDMTGTSIDRSV